MVNTVGIPKSEVIRSLEIASGSQLKEEPDNTCYGKHWIGSGKNGECVILFITDDGFDESPFDAVFGIGKAKMAVDRLRSGL